MPSAETTHSCDPAVRAAVERAIVTLWDHHREPLSLSTVAHCADLSPLRLSRAFRAQTGTSPARFLAAIRLYQAKRLLAETSMSVADVAFETGYRSPRTFSRRFTARVGAPPERYRRLALHGASRRSLMSTQRPAVRPGGMQGLVRVPDETPGMRIYVGAFTGPIVRGGPVARDVLDAPGRYRLCAVPAGDWHIRAAAVPLAPQRLAVGTARAVVRHGEGCVDADIEMRPAEVMDLPILLALPEFDRGGAHPVPRLGFGFEPGAAGVWTA
ncbi:AraC family transcriptional regulator [Catenulispora sp. MAP12-49]|uniref:helix-turn-helix transcriptional regulator n=1 Tax=Catenulispora sp. MAP12-49 TaxID=3156302 RepID=UPI00351244AD